jgi:hypothetical protein
MAYKGCLCDDCFTTQLLPNIHEKIIIPDFQPQFRYLSFVRLIAAVDPSERDIIMANVGLVNTNVKSQVLVDSDRIRAFFDTPDAPPRIRLFCDAAWSNYPCTMPVDSTFVNMQKLIEAVDEGRVDMGTLTHLNNFSLQNMKAEEQVTKTAEQNRLAAEEATKTAEKNRLTAEQNRLAAEQATKTAEQNRLAAVEATTQRKLDLQIQRLQRRSDADIEPSQKRQRRSPAAEPVSR